MLKHFRLAQGMTQKQMADIAGLNVRTIQDWEKNGFSDKAMTDTVIRVAKVLKISVDTLCYFNDWMRDHESHTAK